MINYAIDAHSHIAFENEEYVVGANYDWPILPTLDNYEKIAEENGIIYTLFCPCTTPEIYNKVTKVKENLLLWKYNNGYEYYKQISYDDGNKKIMPLSNNPYTTINNLLYEYLKYKENMAFIPAVNLIYDTPDYLIELINKGAKAVKVHGISIGLDDFKKINIELLKILHLYDIPLMVHTDYSESTSNPIDKLYNANNPLNWVMLLLKYDIRGYLTHGCRLSTECAKIVNNNHGQFLVGISPDLLLEDEQKRLMLKNVDYLSTLLNIYDFNNLSFDIDYGWNILRRDLPTLDSNQLNRLHNYAKNEMVLKRVLKDNSKDFFKIRGV